MEMITDECEGVVEKVLAQEWIFFSGTLGEACSDSFGGGKEGRPTDHRGALQRESKALLAGPIFIFSGRRAGMTLFSASFMLAVPQIAHSHPE